MTRLRTVLLSSQALLLDWFPAALPEEDQTPRLGKYKTPVDEQTIAARLKDLRKRRGLSQAEVAQQLGIHQSLVSEYERGTVRIHGAILAAFARILRTSADQILGLKPLQENGAFTDRRFIRRMERIEKLPKRAKQALIKTIDTYLTGVERG